MKLKHYAAQESVGMLVITMDTGKSDVKFEIADTNLNWNTVVLTSQQMTELRNFLNENNFTAH